MRFRPDTTLEAALSHDRETRRDPAHMSFLPLQYMPIAPSVPNIAFPFWEYPEIPDRDVAGNPRNNWPRVAEKLALIMTACDFTRDAFVRAGVGVPIHVVPVPISGPYFAVPDWQSTGDSCSSVLASCFHRRSAHHRRARLTARARGAYQHGIRPRLPGPVQPFGITRRPQAIRAHWAAASTCTRFRFPTSPATGWS